MSTPKLPGICYLCGGVYAKRSMSQHLKACRKRHEPPADADRSGKAFRRRQGSPLHVVVESEWYVDYWLHLDGSGPDVGGSFQVEVISQATHCTHDAPTPGDVCPGGESCCAGGRRCRCLPPYRDDHADPACRPAGANPEQPACCSDRGESPPQCADCITDEDCGAAEMCSATGACREPAPGAAEGVFAP